MTILSVRCLAAALFVGVLCPVALGQAVSPRDYEGVAFVNDIETKTQGQAASRRIPSLSAGRSPVGRSIPRSWLNRSSAESNAAQPAQQQSQQQPQSKPQSQRSRLNPMNWFGGSRSAQASSQPTSSSRNPQPSQVANQRVASQPRLQPRVQDRQVRPASAEVPVATSQPRTNPPVQRSSGIAMRNTSRHQQVGLLDKFMKKDNPAAATTRSLPTLRPAATNPRVARQPAATATAANGPTQQAASRQPSTRSQQSSTGATTRPMPKTMLSRHMPKPLVTGPQAGRTPSSTTPESVASAGVAWAQDKSQPSTKPATSTPQLLGAPTTTPSATATSAMPVANPFATTSPTTTEPKQYPQTKSTTVEMVENPVEPSTAAVVRPSGRVRNLLIQANSIAQSATTEEEFTQIVQMCRHALAIDNSSVSTEYSKSLAGWALNRRGELKADAGRHSESLIDFDDAISLDSKCWRAIHNRGVLNAQQGEYEAAKRDFNATLKINPKFAKAFSNRAALSVQEDDLDSALADYRQAILLDPDLAIAHKGRGRVCHLLGKFETALQHFDAAALLAPNDPFIAASRADLLVDMGHYHQAAMGYKAAIAINGNVPEPYRGLAWLLATCPSKDCRDSGQALASAERARKLAGTDDDITLDTLAAAMANAGDFTQAIELQKSAVSLASESDRAAFESRLKLYEAGHPYRTEPASNVQQATYVE